MYNQDVIELGSESCSYSDTVISPVISYIHCVQCGVVFVILLLSVVQ